MLGLATGKAMANHFANEARELERAEARWYLWLIGAVVAMLGAVIGATALATLLGFSLASWEAMTLRLLSVAPVALLAWVAIRNHGKTNSLKHEYRHKAAVAESIDAYVKQLSEHHDNVMVAAFLRESATRLFAAPQAAPGTTPLDEALKVLNNFAKNSNTNVSDLVKPPQVAK